MSEVFSVGRGVLSVSPRLIVSENSDQIANETKLPSRLPGGRRSTSSSEWVDVDEDPLRSAYRQRRRRRRSSKYDYDSELSRSSTSTSRLHDRNERGATRQTFARLSQILEINDSASSSTTTSTHGTNHSRHREHNSQTRRAHHLMAAADENSSTHPSSSSSLYRRPAKHRGVAPRSRTSSRSASNSIVRLSKADNRSLLSVLSSLTGRSDRSSGSNTTITQKSYDRRPDDEDDTAMSRAHQTARSAKRELEPNVFNFMVKESMGEEKDDLSQAPPSPSSSSVCSSDAGSSEAPGTPSSRSTFPSPTQTRSQSVVGARQKYESHYAGSNGSVRSGSHSSDVRAKQPTVTDVDEEDEEDDDDDDVKPNAIAKTDHDHRRRSSSNSRSQQRSPDHLRQQHESRRQHIEFATNAQQNHMIENDRHSPTVAPRGADRVTYEYQAALQHYQHSYPPAPYHHPSHHPMNGHPTQTIPPPVPEAPDASQRTIAGYELLALELATQTTTTTPTYRKFEYLNHRILLHLQDELSELEERLRNLDEILAHQLPSSSPSDETKSYPASRRIESSHGTQLHHHRTALLGRVFLKTEQYNKALASHAALSRDYVRAEPRQVEVYRQWMDAHTPVHEAEARFLEHESDLIVPKSISGGQARSQDRKEDGREVVVRTYGPLALMLPLLLFAVVPSLAGRVLVTAVVAAGGFVAVSSTRIGACLEAREWAVCGGVYVLIMVALAGCIPRHV